MTEVVFFPTYPHIRYKLHTRTCIRLTPTYTELAYIESIQENSSELGKALSLLLKTFFNSLYRVAPSANGPQPRPVGETIKAGSE